MIGIITYDNPHRKTQDLILSLLINGYKNIFLIITPWKIRKNFVPLFPHRPTSNINVSVNDMCLNLGINSIRLNITELDKFFSKTKFSYIIIAGAGILPETIAKKFKIINSHPGFLPFSKGLDALKWSIYNDEPIGVTTHFISEKADEGLLIEKKIVPLYKQDSFYNLCVRVYETEIEMLVNSIKLIKTKTAPLTSLANSSSVVNRRMSNQKELIMMDRFEKKRVKKKSKYS